MISLRPYQVSAINGVRAALREGKRRPLICAPTGAGKTVIASAIILGAMARGSRVLYLGPKRELVRQPFCKLLRYGVDPRHVGVVMAGVELAEGTLTLPMAGISAQDTRTDAELWSAFARRRPDALVQIASKDTLLSRKEVPQADIVIIDEAHEALAKGYRWIVEQLPDAIIIGLTATPKRGDRRGLGELFDHLEVVSTYAELAAQGYLVVPEIWGALNLPDISAVRSRAGDLDAEELERLFNTEGLIGDIVEHWEERANGAPTLVFGVNRAHSRAMAARFRQAGHDAVYVDANTPAEERDRIFEGLAKGSPRIVCNCDIAGQGTDVPAVKCVVMARPTKSERVYLQQCGRGSRPYGDLPFIILDHAGNTLGRHAPPEMPREWSLEASKRKRKGASLPPCWQCEQCMRINPIGEPACAHCGACRPVKVRKALAEQAGKLVKLTPDLYADCWELIVAEWRARNAKRKKPLKPGACYYMFKKRFGMAPPKGVAVMPTLNGAQLKQREAFEAVEQAAEAMGKGRGWIHRHTETMKPASELEAYAI